MESKNKAKNTTTPVALVWAEDVTQLKQHDHSTVRPMEGRTGGLTEGRTDGQTDGRTDGRTDRQTLL